VAVRAHHLALVDFLKDALPSPLRQAEADRERFIAQMVKLQDDRVPFAAVDAGIRIEIRDQVSRAL
jgi:hypothetical protein